MNRRVLKHIGLGILFVLTHLLLFQYLTLFGAIADPLIVFLLWLCTRYDRPKALLFAAGFGLFQDMLFDVWGAYMFSKTLIVFITHHFIYKNSENRLMTWQVLLFVWAIAFIHNAFFLGFSNFIDIYSVSYTPVIFLLGSSFYTAVLGAMLFIFKGDKN